MPIISCKVPPNYREHAPLRKLVITPELTKAVIARRQFVHMPWTQIVKELGLDSVDDARKVFNKGQGGRNGLMNVRWVHETPPAVYEAVMITPAQPKPKPKPKTVLLAEQAAVNRLKRRLEQTKNEQRRDAIMLARSIMRAHGITEADLI